MQRFSLVALFALVALANAAADQKFNDLTVGKRESGDELIEQKEVHRGWLPLTIMKEEVTIAGDGNHIITMVEVVDLKRTETSAKPRVMSGGPGQTQVTVGFESARGHGIHFLVKVYGKRQA